MSSTNQLFVYFGLILAFLAVLILFIGTWVRKMNPENQFVGTRNLKGNPTYWKVVKGKIVESRLEFKNASGLMNRSKRLYRAHFEYDYKALGREFRNTPLNQTWTPSKENAQNFVDMHPEGSEVIVRFNPDNPDQSAMQLGTSE